MQITDVKVFPVNEDKLKAFVSIVLDDCFIISDIKIINGNNGLFVSMPSKKRKNGTFRDIAHPLNNETRRMIEERIFTVYKDVLAGGQEPAADLGTVAEDIVSENANPPQS
jgi:stage V sporulation protein G